MKAFNKTMFGLAAGLLATTGISTVAQAADYTFTFTGPGSTLLASGALTTSNTLNGVGGFDVTYVGGTVTGFGPITGLINNPNAPNPINANGFLYDNVLFPAGPPYVNFNGILFSTAGGNLWNIFRSQTVGNDVFLGLVGGSYTPDTSNENVAGTFALTAVPEPTSWALMIGGFGLVGGAMRYRRRSTKVAFAA